MVVWTDENKGVLKNMFEAGKSDREISLVTGGTVKAVTQQRYKLGLKRGIQPPQLVGKHPRGARYPNKSKRYGAHEETALKELYLASRRKGIGLVKKLARKFKRTPGAIRAKLYNMGLLDGTKQQELPTQPVINHPHSVITQAIHPAIIECTAEAYGMVVGKVKDFGCPVTIRVIP